MVFYIAHGFKPLTGLRQGLAQTDLTVVRGSTLLLVEVKYRSSRSRGHVALGQAQRDRLARQMRALAGRYPKYTLRIELFLIFPQWPFYQRISQPYVA